MILIKYTGLLLLIFSQACGQQNDQQQATDQNHKNENNQTSNSLDLINQEGTTVKSRISTPEDFERVLIPQNSFAEYLRLLPLKPDGSIVLFYNGSTKPNKDVYDAVVDLEIGTKDLHQCADAIIRLRAEYLYAQQLYDKIHFNFTNGFRVDYSEWMAGKRIVVNGNETYWSQQTSPSNNYENFWSYLEVIFTYAGTLSLSKELNPIDISEINIGDIFIQGGSPGHAVIIVDMAINSQTREKIFLLAQSYMPAQEIQILKNPNNNNFSPWFSSNFGDILQTPEWTFKKTDLKQFDEDW